MTYYSQNYVSILGSCLLNKHDIIALKSGIYMPSKYRLYFAIPFNKWMTYVEQHFCCIDYIFMQLARLWITSSMLPHLFYLFLSKRGRGGTTCTRVLPLQTSKNYNKQITQSTLYWTQQVHRNKLHSTKKVTLYSTMKSITICHW